MSIVNSWPWLIGNFAWCFCFAVYDLNMALTDSGSAVFFTVFGIIMLVFMSYWTYLITRKVLDNA